MRRTALALAVAGLTLGVATACEPPAPPKVTTVSAAPVGGVAAKSTDPTITPDGRYIVFWSIDTSIVPGFGDGVNEQLFRLDRTTGATVAVSVGVGGAAASSSGVPMGHDPADVSNDGRYVVWTDKVGNLAPGDGDQKLHVYLRDVQAATTTRLDTAPGGGIANRASRGVHISGNGTWITYSSSATNLLADEPPDTIEDAYRVQRSTGATIKVSIGRSAGGAATVADGDSTLPIALDDGRVVLQSKASNLEQGVTHATSDTFIYLVDPAVVPITMVSTKTGGGNAYARLADATPDGRYVAFTSFTDFTGKGGTAWIRDTVAKTTENAMLAKDGKGGSGADLRLSSNGRYVAMYSSTSYTGEAVNGQQVGWVRDRTAGRVWIISRLPGAVPGYVERLGGITADGTTVVFHATGSYTSPAASGSKAWIATAKLS